MSADKQIAEILSRYGEDFKDNTWVVPGGKQRAIYHKTIERIVAKARITFDPPQIVSAVPDNVVLVISGFMPTPEGGIIRDWTFGEASPKNNKNAYPYAMAEKRGKDRVALKLIGLHGLVYSEDEADDFKQPANGNGNGNWAGHGPPAAPLTPDQQRALDAPKAMQMTKLFMELENAITECETLEKLEAISIDRRRDFEKLTEYQRSELRLVYAVKAKALKHFHPEEVVP